MRDTRSAFYAETIGKWIVDRDATVLVVAGGDADHAVFSGLGFRRVTLSNLDPRIDHDHFRPYDWRYEDAQKLQLPDNSYDYVVVHDGLHHLPSPHLGLTEMYRVARKGVAVFEARDSFVMRIIERAQLTQEYEHSAVFYSGGDSGGVNNTEIPNYVFRWTERELEKTIASYAPHGRHRFRYAYGVSPPVTPDLEQAWWKRLVVQLATPAFCLFSAVFRRQRNLFAALIEKPDTATDLHPWLSKQGGQVRFNHEWAAARYRPPQP